MANMNNDEILNELFGRKKKSYSDEIKEKLPQYTPVKKTNNIGSLFSSNSSNGIVVHDIDEVKKRIIGGLGMAMGNNSIRSMANKAIKSFPIIVSDDVDTNTVVMTKTMMEEQYASYIDLLVSNQIINISDYDSNSEKGNIAIQALDRLSGTDFGSSRIARQAQTGNLSMDDVMKNTIGWQLIRNENYATGNPILDTLFEGAIVVSNKQELNEAVSYLSATMLNESYVLNESTYSGKLNTNINGIQSIDDNIVYTAANKNPQQVQFNNGDFFVNTRNGDRYERDATGSWEIQQKANNEKPAKRLGQVINDIQGSLDADDLHHYGFGYKTDADNNIVGKEYRNLLTANVMVDEDSIDKSFDRSIAAVLCGEKARTAEEKEISAFIKDRFEKACYLLSARRIAGCEYVSYLTDRLGLPISSKTRLDILLKYPISSINDPLQFTGAISNGDFAKKLRENIAQNQRFMSDKIIPQLVRLSVKDVLHITAAGAVGVGAAVATSFFVPFITIPAIAGACIGAGTAALYKAIKKARINRDLRNAASLGNKDATIYGWERVEMLISEMDIQHADLAKQMNAAKLAKMGDIDKNKQFQNEQREVFDQYKKNLDTVLSGIKLNESLTNIDGYVYPLTEGQIVSMNELVEACENELSSDMMFMEEYYLEESGAKYIINTKKPGDVIIKQTKLNAKDFASAVPLYGTRDVVAYGSVDYDKKVIKDRKFNEPLILTITFKERYSDGKYTDNELTAVIGILGVVTRVPSDEMAFILRNNAEGKTIKDIFKGEENNNSKSLIGNVISAFAGSSAAERLPTSGKVWHNLEKVSALAVANKLAGGNNGNISNAHIVFSQREIDIIKNELGIDYLKNAKLTAQLMRHYAASMICVCNDAMQYIYTYSDPDAISWEDAPYSAYLGKSNVDQYISAFTQASRGRI